jgi:DNA replication protein DnaC
MIRSSLTQAIRALHLSGLLSSLEVRLAEAMGNRLDHAEFLELVLRDEIAVRTSRQVQRRTRAAMFRESKSLDEFDFAFNTTIPRRQIYDLAVGQFIRQKADVLFLGPPGVGKSFLAQAIGQQAIKSGFMVLYRSIFDLARDFLEEQPTIQQDKTLGRYLKPDLLIIDDMGMKQLPRRSGEYLLEIILRRHENRSTMMTSNRPLEDWGKLIGDAPAATAILDRFLQHAQIISITGRSYRLQRPAVLQAPLGPGPYTSGNRNEDSSPQETAHPPVPREANAEPGRMPEPHGMEKPLQANKISEVAP